MYEEDIKHLISKAKIGDNRAFEELFSIVKGDIYRIAYTYVNNEHDALDILQETACQFYLSINKLKDYTSFKSWILKIAVNKSIDYLRKSKPILAADVVNIIDSQYEDEQSIELFMENLKSLSLEQKSIIIFKCYFDYTFDMIAKELSLSLSTVKTNYYRALEKLRLEEEVI